jgi:hypothetical protein
LAKEATRDEGAGAMEDFQVGALHLTAAVAMDSVGAAVSVAAPRVTSGEAARIRNR